MLTNYGGFQFTASGPIDGEPSALEFVINKRIRLWVHGDGVIAFDFSRWGPGKRIEDPEHPHEGVEKVVLKRCQLMNAFLFALALDDAGPRLRYLNPDDHLHFVDPAARPLGRHARRTGEPLAPDVALIERAVPLFSAIVRNQLINSFDLMAQAGAHQQAHAYEAALTAAWPVVEHFLSQVWDEYLVRNRRRPYPPGVEVGFEAVGLSERQIDEVRTSYEFIDDRRTSLLRSEGFGSAVVTEVLSLLDELPIEAYRVLTRARKARNAWLHRLKPVDSNDAEAAFDAVAALTKKLYGIDFELRVGGSWSGVVLGDEETMTHGSIPSVRPWPPAP